MVAELDSLLTDDLFLTSQLGLMVYDLDADSALYCRGERQRLRPASTQKLLTAIAALDNLSGNYQYTTDLRYTGTIADSTLTGNLFCVGGFDPCFSNADMQAMVNSLVALGIDTIRGCIYADKSMKDGNLLGEGWCWDDKNPVLSPLLYNRKDVFLDYFVDALTERGVVVDAMRMEGRCPDDARTLYSSRRLIDEVLLRMMKESDNLYAESVFYQLAASTGERPASAKHAAGAIKRLIERVGLDPSTYYIADGSGLSLYNYASAELEVRLLRYAWKDSHIFLHLRPSLPESSVDGTLKSRMQDHLTRGRVFAKTGSVTGISSLAGYCIAANGHMLAFCIINQGLRRAALGREFQDKVCAAMCR